MEDIYDGFFPTKLKGRLNECTPIIVIDYTDELFVSEARKILQKVNGS